MPFFSLAEVFDAIVICVALGFIFQDIFRKPRSYTFDPLLIPKTSFSWEDFKFAMAVTAPAIILHELGHKFTALALGASASFHAAYGWLILGIVLKLMNFGFIFFVPAFVAISPQPPLSNALIAFAGPAVNLLLFAISWYLLRTRKFSRTTSIGLLLTKRINLLLFIFNMLPIPGFDGFHVLRGLFLGLF